MAPSLDYAPHAKAAIQLALKHNDSAALSAGEPLHDTYHELQTFLALVATDEVLQEFHGKNANDVTNPRVQKLVEELAVDLALELADYHWDSTSRFRGEAYTQFFTDHIFERDVRATGLARFGGRFNLAALLNKGRLVNNNGGTGWEFTPHARDHWLRLGRSMANEIVDMDCKFYTRVLRFKRDLPDGMTLDDALLQCRQLMFTEPNMLAEEEDEHQNNAYYLLHTGGMPQGEFTPEWRPHGYKSFLFFGYPGYLEYGMAFVLSSSGMLWTIDRKGFSLSRVRVRERRQRRKDKKQDRIDGVVAQREAHHMARERLLALKTYQLELERVRDYKRTRKLIEEWEAEEEEEEEEEEGEDE